MTALYIHTANRISMELTMNHVVCLSGQKIREKLLLGTLHTLPVSGVFRRVLLMMGS